MNVIYDIIDMCLPFAWLEPTFMKNAFLAVLVAAPLFGGLGSFVVSNNMAFYSDAIGHSALTGISLGIILGIKNPILSMVVFSLLLGCAIITVKTKGKTSADTIIGVFSSAAVALGLVLLSATGNFAKYQKYLVGDILSIQPSEIALLLVVALLVIIIWTLFYNKMLLTNMHRTFAKSRGVSVFFIEQLFALTTAHIVAVSIHWTGLLVINSLLVLPAAAARLVTRSSRSYVLTSVLISLLSSVIGLIISYYWDSVSGATIVLVNTVAFVVCLILGSLRKK